MKQRIAYSAKGILALGSLCANFSAYSQTAPAAPTSSGTELNEIVVTAQRRQERLQDVPISITAQTSADLERAGVTETRDLATVVPGLLFVGQGAWVQPNLRGVSTTITGADNPIALYLDGVYMPSQNSMIFDLPDVSHIEVLKGPQGTLFGRNATGGAIQIFTENPSFTPSGRFSVSGGVYAGDKSSPDYGFTGFVTGPLIGETVAGSLSAYYDKTEGYMTDIVANRRYGEIESKLIRGKLLFQFSDNVKLTLSGFYSHRHDEAAEAGLPLNGVTAGSHFPGSIVATKPWTIADDSPMPLYVAKMYGGSAKLDIDFDVGTLSAVTGYSKLEASENVDVDASYSPQCLAVFSCISYLVTTPQETESEEITFASKKFFDRLSFTSGLFAYVDRGGTGGGINGFLAFDNVVHTHAYAVFTELNFDITDRLVAIAGARYSWESKQATGSFDPAPRTQYVDVTFNSVTPRASLRYKVTDDANVYFTYSEGFKSGVTPTNAFNAPATKPEKIKAYEVGAKVASQRYALNTALFYYDYKDKQEQFFDGLVSFPKNVASAEIYGAELDGTWQVTDDWQTRLGVSWLPTAKYKSYPEAVAFDFPVTAGGTLTQYAPYDASGVRLNTTPKLTGNLTAIYTKHLPIGTLESTGTLYYSSEYQWEVTGRVKTDSYVTLNAQVSLAPTDNWKATLYGKNLTNREYVNSVLLTPNSDMVMYAPPRLVGVKLDYNF